MKNSILYLSIFLTLSLISLDSSAQKASKKASKKGKLVLISTSYGEMKFKLYDETPLHKANFLRLVNEGFYDSLTFHRVIKNFMIQGGNPNTSQKVGVEKGTEGALIPAEFNPALIHKKGALAAARTGDNVNPEKKSSGSQFYIVQGVMQTDASLKQTEKKNGITIPDAQKEVYKTIGGSPHLDQNYTVFGEIIEGMEVIDKLAAVKTGPGDVPFDLLIFSIKTVKK
jgi:cyclophilin family peptidyl-prolyl cis-trans isomerase